MSYNGRTNYETWLVNLWMDNEPGGKEFALDYLKEFKDAYADDKRVSRFADTYRHPSALNPTNNATVSGITYSLSQFLKETYEEDVDTLSLPPFWNDLLRGALSEVNWMETASHIMEEWEERVEQSERDQWISVSPKKQYKRSEEKEND